MKKITILTLLILVIKGNNMLFAQTSYYGKTLTLNGATGCSYYARDWIQLNEGLYTVSNYPFEAKIDESLLYDVEYQATQPDPNRSLDKTLPVGSIPGSFDVSPTGAATYTIPIEVPPGTAGMQPNLAITYNSQSGNGLLGIGWNLSGLSAITRVNQNYFYDNKIRGVEFDYDDKFVLDGNRLELTSGTYGYDGSVYRTVNENFSKITAYGTAGKGPQWFKVETKDGITVEFGNTADSRIEAQGKSDVLIWNINKISDVNGNYITFTYGEDNAAGEFWLNKIEYTGNSVIGLTPYNKINFFYEKREDAYMGFVKNSQVQQSRLLRKIKVESENQTTRSYSFKYVNDFYTHLTEIIETGSDESKLNSTIINWGNTTDNFLKVITNYIGDVKAEPIYCGDFNGDGKTDFVKFRTNGGDGLDSLVLFLNKDGQNFERVWKQTLLPGYLNFNNNIYFQGKSLGNQVFDFNGDGLDDLLLVRYVNLKPSGECVGDKCEFYYFYALKSEGNKFTTEELLDMGYSLNTKYLFGDFNGDGKTTEIFTVGKNDYLYNFDLRVIDFNGDGKMDVMAINNNENFNIEDGCIIFDGGDKSKELYHSGFPSKWHEVYHGDFNGDGKSDVLTYADGVKWTIAYSTGNGYAWPYKEVPIPVSNTRKNNHYVIDDFNGDGISDILELEFVKNIAYQGINIYYNNINNFEREHWAFNFELFPPTINTSFIPGDFNGDGKKECIAASIYFDIYETVGKSFITRFHPFEKKHLVHTIINGYNQKTEINYKSLTDNTVYKKGTGGAYPFIDIQHAIYAVSSVNTTNGAGGNTTLSFNYEGAKYHLQGLGYMGFTKNVTTNNATGIKTSQQYKIAHTVGTNTYYIPLPTESTVELDGETLLRKTNTYKFHEYGNKRIFPYASQTITKDYLRDAATSVTSTIDAEGNPTLVINSNGELSGETVTWIAPTETIYQNYFDAISGDGNTIKNRPQDIIVRKSHADHYNNSFETATKITYTGKGQVLQKKEYYNKPNQLTYDYEYYTTGHLKKESVSATGYDIRYTTYQYDTKYRFMVKQTDAMGNYTQSEYDGRTGNITSSTDIFGKTTTFSYDGFGRLTTTTLPTGKKITQSINWLPSGTTIPNAIFYITTSPEGGVPVTEYYDILGRSLQKVTKNFNGSDIVTTTKYNSIGQVTETTAPPASGSTALKTTYTYDKYGRIEKEMFDNTYETKYTYNSANGRYVKVTNTSTGQFTEKTLDALGNLKEVKDAGGTITYKYHASQQLREVKSPGSTITIEYDEYGRQKSLKDPDAGIITYDYTPFGELKMQKDARQNQYDMVYDKLGRITTKTGPEGATSYEYYTSGNGKTLLKKVTGPNGMYELYTYDDFGRVISKNEYIENGQSFTTSYEYDGFGRTSKITYPNNFEVNQIYNNYGYLSEVRNAADNSLIWKGKTMNAANQWTEYELGQGLLKTTKTYNNYGYISSIKTNKIGASSFIQCLSYGFNLATGNLNWRIDHMHIYDDDPLTETFTYDGLNRLISINNPHGKINMDYNNEKDGNLVYKTDIGYMNYTSTKPHAITQVDNDNGLIPTINQTITYTPFNKVNNIEEPYPVKVNIDYGPSQTRKKTTIIKIYSSTKERYYSGLYEKEITGGNTREYCYIAGGDGLAAVYITENGSSGSIYYIATDYLGSINMLIDNTGAIAQFNGKAQEYSFDAWGRRRNPNDWSYNNIPADFLVFRGFTGHEHLDAFDLINMNGRMYDPYLGRFLSPDNYVQKPDATQSFNRYTYCLNNPLVYTDPSGEWFGYDDAIVAALGFVVGYVSYGISTGDWGWDAVASGGITAGASWLTYNTAGATSSWLLEAEASKATAAVLGNAVGGAVGSFAGNVAGQAYFNGSVDLGQAGQSALYGFGYGIGSGLVDVTPLMEKQFFMHHTVKYMLRSTAGELTGNLISDGYGSMTYGLNPGIVLPLMSDVSSLTSPYWSSKIAQKKYNSLIEEANENGVGVNSDIELRSKLDYGYYTEESGYWIAGSNEGDFIFNEVGISARLKVLNGGISIDKIGSITPKGLNFSNLSGLRIDIPIYQLPFNNISAIHFANAYSLSYRLWRH
jgi:RHS repeat-associated protein